MSAALTWHLQHNHFPPLPDGMIPYAELAIAMQKRGEDGPLTIDGGTLRDGTTPVTASDLIEQLHLHEFVKGA